MRVRPFLAVYITASGRNGTLYIGVTSNLIGRILKHELGTFDGFSKKYGCTRLVWYETFELVTNAIRREKQLKRYLRKWKLKLIEDQNPEWRDLAEELFDLFAVYSGDAGSSGLAFGQPEDDGLI